MSTRRTFLGNLGWGAATLAVAGDSALAGQLPGQPPTGNQPHTSKISSIMAIAAHPGDGFFAMGAPVALQTHAGARGVFLSLTLGERGSAKIEPATYGRMQREAAEHAAQAMGAESVCLEHPDGELPINDEVKFAVCDLIREHKPEVIVTHWRGSWHKDHQACHTIVNDAVFYAGLPAIQRKLPAHNARSLYFADNWEDATDFSADTYLDITPVFDRWMQACAAFPMWRGENGFRYNDYYGSLAVCRGCVSGYSKAVALMSAPEQRTRKMQTL